MKSKEARKKGIENFLKMVFPRGTEGKDFYRAAASEQTIEADDIIKEMNSISSKALMQSAFHFISAVLFCAGNHSTQQVTEWDR
ncbi:hypothetical protein [Dialister sp.]|uniref:hypothetical protein n=1 Tax=Dialister sp. TaxID=1955814 RepID=UPI003F050EA1